jgi:hypothetical protein
MPGCIIIGRYDGIALPASQERHLTHHAHSLIPIAR